VPLIPLIAQQIVNLVGLIGRQSQFFQIHTEPT
jgi:hypothetical protein